MERVIIYVINGINIMFFFVVFDIVVYLEEKDLFDCDVFDWIVLFEVVFDVWLVM